MFLAVPCVFALALVIFGGLVVVGRKPASWGLYAQSVAVATVVLVLIVAAAVFGPWAQLEH